MQEVFEFLRFMTEIGEEYEDGWLPTLDISLKVEEETGEVKCKFFENPTTSKTQILANDLVRRLIEHQGGHV